ncbi:MAG: hypothetical protein ACKN9W_02850 [Methylococcus sp.]
MHFRTRNNLIQVIRTTYDPDTKKGKNEIVARMAAANPQINDAMIESLSASELQEVEQWIEEKVRLDAMQNELAARSLSESIQKAAKWFAATSNKEEARATYAGITKALRGLKKAVNQAGLLEE